ncbi:MAG TPA: dTDP-4-dehydrorhamnose 3,5-epimerase [Mycobacteriales bacterium]|nr:dTDP-4-dehydrorhamnose 3,5-epimerase [Mycobacteriales bacterium]
MRIEPLAVPDSWVCSPIIRRDDRGQFLEWHRGDLLAEATGRSFAVMQANHSVSARGVVRGIHLADVPAGQAKLVYCTSGAILDVIVDVRTGSPTYGAVDAVRLDAVDSRAVFISEGLGHAFCALTDDASVTYLVSTTYDPATERTVSPIDPALALPWPTDVGELRLSEKDRDAPSLAAAASAGLLPSYDACLARYAELARAT